MNNRKFLTTVVVILLAFACFAIFAACDFVNEETSEIGSESHTLTESNSEKNESDAETNTEKNEIGAETNNPNSESNAEIESGREEAIYDESGLVFTLDTSSSGYIVTRYTGTETNVVIPSTCNGYCVTGIGDAAFEGCIGLVSIEIPDSVTSIGDNAFVDCENIENVTIPAMAIEHIHKNNLKTVVISSGDSIDEYAFSHCANLTSVTLPDSVTSIGSGVFFDCVSLTSIEIPGSVTSIGSDAFFGCTSLVSVEFANTSGWWVSEFSDATSGTGISGADLSDHATAAEYLTSLEKYCLYYWKRS